MKRYIVTERDLENTYNQTAKAFQAVMELIKTLYKEGDLDPDLYHRLIDTADAKVGASLEYILGTCHDLQVERWNRSAVWRFKKV